MTIFANAAAAPTKKTAKKADASKDYVDIEGVEAFASICVVEKALKAIKGTLEADIKTEGVELMVTEGLRLKARPASIDAKEGNATANIQLKAKASNIAISEEDQERLAEHNIPLRVSEKVATTFIINPAYAEDEKVLAKVSKALEKVPGLPADFILKQEDTITVCDGDTTLNAIFALKDRAIVEALLPLVTSTAIKPTMQGELVAAIANVAALLGGSLAAPAKPSAKAKRAAKKADCTIEA